MTTKALQTLIDHCGEAYPHFESERGAIDIQAAIDENTELREALKAAEDALSRMCRYKGIEETTHRTNITALMLVKNALTH